MAQGTCCPVISPKELNFRKELLADILHALDNFSWISEGKGYPNCLKYRFERSWY